MRPKSNKTNKAEKIELVTSKVNSHTVKVSKNWTPAPDQPVVLLYDLKNDLIPGEALYFGPLCNCTKCLIAYQAEEEKSIHENGVTQRKSPSKKDVGKSNKMTTSTPYPVRSDQSNETRKENETRDEHLNTLGIRDISGFSEVDSDSGWDKRQELLVRLSRNLEKQVDSEMAAAKKDVVISSKKTEVFKVPDMKRTEEIRSVQKRIYRSLKSKNLSLSKNKKEFINGNQSNRSENQSKTNSSEKRKRCDQLEETETSNSSQTSIKSKKKRQTKNNRKL